MRATKRGDPSLMCNYIYYYIIYIFLRILFILFQLLPNGISSYIILPYYHHHRFKFLYSLHKKTPLPLSPSPPPYPTLPLLPNRPFVKPPPPHITRCSSIPSSVCSGPSILEFKKSYYSGENFQQNIQSPTRSNPSM